MTRRVIKGTRPTSLSQKQFEISHTDQMQWSITGGTVKRLITRKVFSIVAGNQGWFGRCDDHTTSSSRLKVSSVGALAMSTGRLLHGPGGLTEVSPE